MNHEDDDIILVENIDEEFDEELGEPIIGIYRRSDGGISFSSKLSGPLETAKVFNGLAWHILEHTVG